MANIGLGFVDGIYASRAISGAGQYLPDSSSILTKSGGATSDTWGAAMLAGLNGTSEGFLVSPNQDVEIQFVGNTGVGAVQEYDPVIANWRTTMTFTDALAHVIRAPSGPWRLNADAATGTTYVTMKTSRSSGQL